MKTLIVEDDFTGRFFLQAFLSRFGECHVAVNGREAVEAFRMATQTGTPYELICMDILMPEMDGKEAVQRVRNIEEAAGIYSDRSAKIIMTTAVDEAKDVIDSFHALCDAYIFKPIDTAQLTQHLRNFRLIA